MLPCRAGGLTLCWHRAPPSPAGGPAWLGRSGGSFGCKQGPFGNSEARCCLSVPPAAGLWELLVQVEAVLLLGVQGQRSRSSRVPVLRCRELWRRQQEALVLWFCSSLCLWRDQHSLGHVWGELGVPRAPTRWGQHGGHALSGPGAQQGARCGSGLVAGSAGCAGGSRQQLQSLGCGVCGGPLGVPKRAAPGAGRGAGAVCGNKFMCRAVHGDGAACASWGRRWHTGGGKCRRGDTGKTLPVPCHWGSSHLQRGDRCPRWVCRGSDRATRGWWQCVGVLVWVCEAVGAACPGLPIWCPPALALTSGL